LSKKGPKYNRKVTGKASIMSKKTAEHCSTLRKPFRVSSESLQKAGDWDWGAVCSIYDTDMQE
jgi:hypothetical protein